MNDIVLPSPSKKEIDYYLQLWDSLDNYYLQESALDKLFFETYPKNTDIDDILIKVSALNDFYSTNIFNVFAVATHIKELNIDNRLKIGDTTLVDDIAYVEMADKNGKKVIKHFYSFATKYCSHHFPDVYPIYDSYVDRCLLYFKNQDNFFDFNRSDLKHYDTFKTVLLNFKKYALFNLITDLSLIS